MYRKIFFVQLVIIVLMLSAFVTNTIAQTGEPIISVDNIIGAITPLIIFAVTWVIQRIKPTIVGWNIVWVVVPILSLAASTILALIDQATSFWSQFIWNFLSVVVAQLILQLSADKRQQNAVAKRNF